jgi:hypothetical protein
MPDINPDFPESGSEPWDAPLLAALEQMVSAINEARAIIDSRPHLGFDTDGNPIIILPEVGE